jgi:hypothetical protein
MIERSMKMPKTAKPKKKKSAKKRTTAKKKGSKKSTKKKGAKKKRTEAKGGLTPTQTAIMAWAVGKNKKKDFTYNDIRKEKTLPSRGLSSAVTTSENSLVNKGFVKAKEAPEGTDGRVLFSLTAKGKKFKA